MTAYAADLALAVAAARAAGALTLRWFGRAMTVHHKAPDQPVTAADLEADACIRRLLLGERPAYGWLSEETPDSADRLDRARVWIVDPIDGTRSFVAGRPEYTISIGLAVDGSAVAGVVYNPPRDELYFALRGAGAWLETGGGARRPLRLAPAAPRGDVVMLASRGEIAAGDFAPFRDDWRIEPVGSTAYKLARVAEGRGNAFVSRGPKSEWDVCAGVLIVEEAGGRASDLTGGEPVFNRRDPALPGIVAAAGPVHEALLRRIAGLPVPARWAEPAAAAAVAADPGDEKEDGPCSS